jgi:hypothetical protein
MSAPRLNGLEAGDEIGFNIAGKSRGELYLSCFIQKFVVLLACLLWHITQAARR